MDKALEWVGRVLGGPVTRHERMAGATSSEVFRLEPVDRPPVVLRLFTNAEWLAMEPDLAEHEAAALEAVTPLPVPTPELLAFDPTGSESGVPALLMSELSGSVELRPPNMATWTEGLAQTLATLHSFDPGRFPWTYRVWQDLDHVSAPIRSEQRGLWEEVINRARRGIPPCPARFIHRDFHPTNVLWSQGSVSGVVDWVNACWGPPAIDVAHCRLNLAAMYGLEQADDFARRYESRTGRETDPIWDLLAVVEWLPEGDIYQPWLNLGLADLDTPTVRSRLEDFAEKALAAHSS